jgi:hypothetical protein
MKIEIRDRDRRAVLVRLGAAAIYGVLSFGALPVFDTLKEASAETIDKEDILARYRRALIRKGHYASLLEEARQAVSNAEGRLLRGDNPSLAAVELQTIVEEAAKNVGLSLNQRNIAPVRKRDELFNETAITMAFEATLGQVTRFLAEIRQSPKFVTVRSAQIAPTQVAHEAPAAGDLLKTVRANLTIVAALPNPAPVEGEPR